MRGQTKELDVTFKENKITIGRGERKKLDKDDEN